MNDRLAASESERIYPFLSEVAELRRRARSHMQAGCISADLSITPPTIVRLLNEALATERVCVERYRRHSVLAGGAVAETVRSEFLKYVQEEQGHAQQLAERIVQLGGQPPADDADAKAIGAGGLSQDIEADALADLLEEDLIAERIAIDSYREMVQFLGSSDPATRQLLESILSVELLHAGELAGMRADVLRRDRCGATSSRLPILEPQ